MATVSLLFAQNLVIAPYNTLERSFNRFWGVRVQQMTLDFQLRLACLNVLLHSKPRQNGFFEMSMITGDHYQTRSASFQKKLFCSTKFSPELCHAADEHYYSRIAIIAETCWRWSYYREIKGNGIRIDVADLWYWTITKQKCVTNQSQHLTAAEIFHRTRAYAVQANDVQFRYDTEDATISQFISKTRNHHIGKSYANKTLKIFNFVN